MNRIIIFSIFFLLITFTSLFNSQVENVPVSHPVYSFLKRMWIRQNLTNVSFFKIPLTRDEVVSMLKEIQSNSNHLSSMDRSLLKSFELDFQVIPNEPSSLILNRTNTLPLLSENLLSERDKCIYYFNDSINSVSIKPLGSLSLLNSINTTESKNAIFGELGFRAYGTLGNCLGYFLQVTNGKFFFGNREFALKEEKRLSNSVKFSLLNSDFDLVESHIRYEKNWFYTGFARETRLLGSGINQTIVISDNAPPMDEFFAGVKFKNFRYEFSHFSLIAKSKNSFQTGVDSDIPPKFLVMHRASFLFPKWNVTYFETVMYSGRSIELAYLNPFTFLKSVEHSLHDRDKSTMGLSFEINPFCGVQIVGTWMLEDLIFSEIGKGFWGNKTAWNIGGLYSFTFPLDVGIEYTRIEPYMFTHFNNQNNRTNDGKLIGTPLQPNSDEITFFVRAFLFTRYPLTIRIGYIRHGANVVDDSGRIVRNVGGDFNVNHSVTDSWIVSFLDGILQDQFTFDLSYGINFFRNFNLRFFYQYRKSDKNPALNIFKLTLKFEDF
ncbi:MAG: hypothetical protein ACUVQ1_02290 [Candidatus Kapaibacteriales bacterium]